MSLLNQKKRAPALLVALTSDKEMNNMAKSFLNTSKFNADCMREWGVYEISDWIRDRDIDIFEPYLHKGMFRTMDKI